MLLRPRRSIRQLKKDIKARYAKQAAVDGLVEASDAEAQVMALSNGSSYC